MVTYLYRPSLFLQLPKSSTTSVWTTNKHDYLFEIPWAINEPKQRISDETMFRKWTAWSPLDIPSNATWCRRIFSSPVQVMACPLHRTWASISLMSIRPLRTNFGEIWNKKYFFFHKNPFKNVVCNMWAVLYQCLSTCVVDRWSI